MIWKVQKFGDALTFDWNCDVVAFLRLDGVWRYEDSIGTVNSASVNTAEAKLELCLVGADLLLLDLIRVLVDVEEKWSHLTGSNTCGRYLLPFFDHTLVKAELRFWQAWKTKMCKMSPALIPQSFEKQSKHYRIKHVREI